ncbi:hypothetical protein EKA14_16070 [Bacillus mycoides]|nr:hypothetical protein EKA14_16070 [Bacillus mycoides]
MVSCLLWRGFFIVDIYNFTRCSLHKDMYFINTEIWILKEETRVHINIELIFSILWLNFSIDLGIASLFLIDSNNGFLGWIYHAPTSHLFLILWRILYNSPTVKDVLVYSFLADSAGQNLPSTVFRNAEYTLAC